MGDGYVVSRAGGGLRLSVGGKGWGGGVSLSVEKKGACCLKRLRRGRGCNVWSREK